MPDTSDHRWKPLAELLATRIRYKVLAAAAVTVALMGLIGWIGFRYIHAVAQSVAVTTQRTSPLLSGALAASEATRRLVSSARDTDRVCANEDGAEAEQGSASWRVELGSIERLQGVARSAGLHDHAQSVADASRTLGGTLASVAALCREKHDALNTLRQKQHEALLAVEQLNTDLTALALVLDDRMTISEEHAKVGLQAGGERGDEGQRTLTRTLLDTWPMLRSLYRLREHTTRLKDLISQQALPGNSDELDVQNATRAEGLDAAKSLVRRLVPRLRVLSSQAEADRLGRSLESIEAALRGPDGLESSLSAYLGLGGEAERMEAMLGHVEQKLSLEMKGLEDEARRLDSSAQATMNGSIQEATWVIGLVAGLAALATLIAALRFTDRLTRPLETLTAHARRLQRTQDVNTGLPRELEQRRDEIGRLASSFGDMIEALAEARRRLMAESKAEIKIQVERLKAAIEGMPQGIFLVDADNRLLLSNARFAELYGLRPAQVAFGTPADEINAACETNGARVEVEVVQALHAEGAARADMCEAIRTLADGRTMVVTRAETPDGGAIFVHEDITERRRAEARIEYMAHHDALTGLANRTLFREETNQSLARRQPQDRLAVLYMDLDHFKAVNDTLGHPVGDRLLVIASKRLCGCLRENDHVARLGGDEFAVVLNSNPSPDEVATLAERIIETVSQPYDIDGQQVVIGVSIGIAMAPSDGEDADRLMQGADMALYRAKRDGRNTHCFFEPEMDARMQERRVLEMALRKAIAEEALQVHYQPLVNIASGRVEEFEALLRWTDPERGAISPEVFIPLAEETGLIGELSAWVLRRACLDATGWPGDVRVAVNISPLSFRTRTLVLTVISALEASGLRPDRLELEITEGVLLNDTQATLLILRQLQDIGVRIAMDDFGTGYSSLSYLRKFNFNKVKIDRSFVSELDKTKDSRAIIRAVSGLCNTLGIEITAEGVETERQLETLRDEGCTQVQGYLLGRPGPASTVAGYFGEGHEVQRKA